MPLPRLRMIWKPVAPLLRAARRRAALAPGSGGLRAENDSAFVGMSAAQTAAPRSFKKLCAVVFFARARSLCPALRQPADRRTRPTQKRTGRTSRLCQEKIARAIAQALRHTQRDAQKASQDKAFGLPFVVASLCSGATVGGVCARYRCACRAFSVGFRPAPSAWAGLRPRPARPPRPRLFAGGRGGRAGRFLFLFVGVSPRWSLAFGRVPAAFGRLCVSSCFWGCSCVLVSGCLWFGGWLRRVVLARPRLVSVCVRVRPGGLVFFLRGGVRLCAALGCALACGLSWLRRPSLWRVLVCLRAGVVCAALALRGGGLMSAFVGFSGSRSLSPAFAPLVRRVVASVVGSGRPVAVGCAAGLDAVVRSACPSAVVFSAASFGVGRSSFARRSAALVSACSALVVFPSSPCPAGLVPSASASACFCGLGSGSWASAAFAAGLGLPVVVFPCGFSALPSWGAWSVAGAGCWAAGFRLVSAPAQPALF